LREEIIFSAIDKLSASDFLKVPKRAVIRKFVRAENAQTVDAGAWTLSSAGGVLKIARKKAAKKRGFALLIKNCASYTLEGLAIECREAAFWQGEGGCFFGNLPLALRSPFPDDCVAAEGGNVRFAKMPAKKKAQFSSIITAADGAGEAAFVGAGTASGAEPRVIAARKMAGDFVFIVRKDRKI
jgi:hypothetical protein